MSHKPDSRWDHMMLQYAVITDSICPSLLQLVKAPPHDNRASSMLYDWCDKVGCVSFPNSSLYIDHLIWPKDFKHWFISPKDFIPILYCPVFVCLGPLEPFDIVLLPQQWFLDSNSTIEANFTVSSSHSGCWYIFFMILVQLYSDVWSSQPSVIQDDDSDEIVLCIGKTGCIQQAVIQQNIV